MKILVSDKIAQKGLDYFKESEFEIDYRPEISAEELVVAVKDAVALVVRSRTKVTSDVISAGKNLQVIARVGTGVDNIDVIVAKQKGIIVVNAPGANSESVAEHTMALILALSRNIFKFAQKLAKGVWAKKEYEAIELKGKALGIIGFGRIGQRVAQLGCAFGMDILVFNRTTTGEKKEILDALGGSRFVSLDELLKTSDVVTLHVPKSSDTLGLIGEKELSLMKRCAYLINCARGGIINEDALVSALKNKTIAGCALDVYNTEPLTGKSPFYSLDNVLLTPHVGATSVEAAERASTMIAQDVAKVLKGEKAENTV